MYEHYITAPSACANITLFRYNTAAGTPIPLLQLLVSIVLVDYAVPHINLMLCLGKHVTSVLQGTAVKTLAERSALTGNRSMQSMRNSRNLPPREAHYTIAHVQPKLCCTAYTVNSRSIAAVRCSCG
jgi:hypothetical protein